MSCAAKHLGGVCKVTHRWSNALAAPGNILRRQKLFPFPTENSQFQSNNGQFCDIPYPATDSVLIGQFRNSICDSVIVEIAGPDKIKQQTSAKTVNLPNRQHLPPKKDAAGWQIQLLLAAVFMCFLPPLVCIPGRSPGSEWGVQSHCSFGSGPDTSCPQVWTP